MKYKKKKEVKKSLKISFNYGDKKMELETISLRLMETNKKVNVIGKKHVHRNVIYPLIFRTFETANKAIKDYKKIGVRTRAVSSCGNIYLAKERLQ